MRRCLVQVIAWCARRDTGCRAVHPGGAGAGPVWTAAPGVLDHRRSVGGAPFTQIVADPRRTTVVRTRTRTSTRSLTGIVVLLYVLIGIVVAWQEGYITVGLLKNILSAILAVLLWFLVLLGVDFNL